MKNGNMMMEFQANVLNWVSLFHKENMQQNAQPTEISFAEDDKTCTKLFKIFLKIKRCILRASVEFFSVISVNFSKFNVFPNFEICKC